MCLWALSATVSNPLPMRASADKSGESGGTRSDIAFGPRNIRSKNDLIGIFARHRTAAHLLMVLMIIAGFFGLNRMTTQFFPDFGIDVVLVTVSWPGAGAGDVDGNIVQAIEREVRFVDSVKAVKSSAFEGRASVAIEFEAGSDMQSALSNIETAVGQVTTLPEDAETPTIRRIFRYDTLSRILVSGPFSETALKTYAKQIRDGLLRRGVDKVDIGGARNEEILVEIRPATLRRLELTLNDVARKIRQTTQDVPSGDVSGRAERQLRSIGEVKTARELGRIEIKSLANGEKILLREIATVREAFDSDGRTYWRGKNRAIQLHAKRTPADDALILADEVEKYLEEIKPTLPPNLKLERYDVQADLIRSRISLLLSNGATGLIIVLVVLFLFLNGWVAFWVAVGIPISLAATMMAMWLTDQSINMVSLFALIMTIGIIVDDAIVVGEHSESLHRQGYNNSLAAEAGARRMATPVLCASLTTIAAFLPLLLITDVVGSIIRTIPLVVIAVILASLIECFLVLPGHMRHALGTGSGRRERSGSFSPLLGIGLAWIWPLIPAVLVGRHVVMPFKRGFDRAFEGFRERLFLPLVRLTIRWRYTTAALAIATLIGAASVVAGGRINFVFFPNPEVDNIFATAEFSAGTPRARTQAMVAELERALHAADRKLTGGKGGLVRFNFSLIGAPLGTRPASSPVTGNHVGGMFIQLVPADQRTVVSGQFISAWRKEIRNMPGLQQVNIKAATGGPPGRDVDVRLTGASTAQLKKAAQELKTLLRTIPGIRAIEDSQPYGKIESILELTPRGRALGFTTESVGRQVRNTFEGAIAKRFARGDEEVVVRVRFPQDRLSSEALYNLHLRAPNGSFVPLSAIVSIREKQGFARIKREEGAREVAVTADLNTSVMTTQQAIVEMKKAGLDDLASKFGFQYRFEGRDKEQKRTFTDMAIGAGIGLVLIFVILAWVFAGYMRPLVVMSVIPMGFVGAVLGHYLMGYDLTILSLIALIGLSGIVVNNSIILVSTVKERTDAGEPAYDAIANGARDRLRAIILTSATTIGGLTPLLFETDLQARFLIPMAITMVFGLMIATLLVLIVVPSLIAIQVDIARIFSRRDPHGAGAPVPAE